MKLIKLRVISTPGNLRVLKTEYEIIEETEHYLTVTPPHGGRKRVAKSDLMCNVSSVQQNSPEVQHYAGWCYPQDVHTLRWSFFNTLSNVLDGLSKQLEQQFENLKALPTAQPIDQSIDLS